jgi:hypothetical protein
MIMTRKVLTCPEQGNFAHSPTSATHTSFGTLIVMALYFSYLPLLQAIPIKGTMATLAWGNLPQSPSIQVDSAMQSQGGGGGV